MPARREPPRGFGGKGIGYRFCFTSFEIEHPNVIYLSLQDNEFPFQGFTNLRLTARGIVFDERGLVAVHHIKRNDLFGDQEYFETPGGGVDEGETVEQALLRECREELGEEVEILCPLGIVEDAYNAIQRRNQNHYFLCQKTSQGKAHFVSEGDSLIQETLYLPLDEAIQKMRSQPKELVSRLVKQRELPILEEACRILKENPELRKRVNGRF